MGIKRKKNNKATYERIISSNGTNSTNESHKRNEAHRRLAKKRTKREEQKSYVYENKKK